MAAAQPPLKLNVNGLSAPRAAAPVTLWPMLAHVIHKYKYFLILAQILVCGFRRNAAGKTQIILRYTMWADHYTILLLRHHFTPELIIAELDCYWKASTKVSPWELLKCSPCSTKVQQAIPLVLPSGLTRGWEQLWTSRYSGCTKPCFILHLFGFHH